MPTTSAFSPYFSTKTQLELIFFSNNFRLKPPQNYEQILKTRQIPKDFRKTELSYYYNFIIMFF